MPGKTLSLVTLLSLATAHDCLAQQCHINVSTRLYAKPHVVWSRDRKHHYYGCGNVIGHASLGTVVIAGEKQECRAGGGHGDEHIYIYNLAKRISGWVGSHALTCPQIGPTPNSSSPTN
jgi:hypothetical protein